MLQTLQVAAFNDLEYSPAEQALGAVDPGGHAEPIRLHGSQTVGEV